MFHFFHEPRANAMSIRALHEYARRGATVRECVFVPPTKHSFLGRRPSSPFFVTKNTDEPRPLPPRHLLPHSQRMHESFGPAERRGEEPSVSVSPASSTIARLYMVNIKMASLQCRSSQSFLSCLLFLP